MIFGLSSGNLILRDNTEGTFSKRKKDSVETTRQPLISAGQLETSFQYCTSDISGSAKLMADMTKAYLLGALHDATIRKITYRIGAKDLSYAEFLKKGITALGHKAWIYKEGKSRNYYIVEFVKSILDQVALKSFDDKIDYIRGYFDTDGGIARSKNVRYYLYFAQKNKNDLANVKNYLEQLNISCGIIHNPSKSKDASYFRFFIKAESYQRFAEILH